MRSMAWVTLLAIAVRWLCLPFALHVEPKFIGDIVSMNWQARLLVTDAAAARLIYPPVAYYTMALFQAVFDAFTPALPTALAGRQALLEWASSASVFRQLFFLKLWYLPFDLGTALVLWRLFDGERRKARMAATFWLLNPVVVYGAYFHGQFDVVPAFFVVLAIYLARTHRTTGTLLCLGIAACYKSYPLLLAPPAVLALERTWRRRFALLLIGTVPFVALMLPHLGRSQASLSQYGEWFFRGGYSLGLGAQVYTFFVFYGALLVWQLVQPRAPGYSQLWRVSLAMLLVYYQFSYFDLHYWVWIVPFAAVYWLENRREALPYFLIIGLCLLALTTPTPLARFLAPISPRFFLRLPSLMEALSPYMPMLFFTNVVRSLLAGTCFYLAWKLVWDAPSLRHPAGPVEMSPATRS